MYMYYVHVLHVGVVHSCLDVIVNGICRSCAVNFEPYVNKPKKFIKEVQLPVVLP